MARQTGRIEWTDDDGQEWTVEIAHHAHNFPTVTRNGRKVPKGDAVLGLYERLGEYAEYCECEDLNP